MTVLLSYASCVLILHSCHVVFQHDSCHTMLFLCILTHMPLFHRFITPAPLSRRPQFASRTRQLCIRLLALVKWAGSVSKVDKSAVIMSFLDKQSMLFVDTADKLSQMARQEMVREGGGWKMGMGGWREASVSMRSLTIMFVDG